MNKQPLISCLCVTHNKPDLLLRAIRCFRSQTYANKELVILYETNDVETAGVVESLHEPNIYSVAINPSPRLTLGELRNESIRQCHGEYFCQWDDDDWYHPSRLEIQFNAIQRSGKQASALTHWLLFDTLTEKAYCSHRRIWEGSLMCQTNIALTQIKYPPYGRGEDNQFIAELNAHYAISHVPLPMLYVYTYNGSNTWDYSHFTSFYKKGYPLTSWATDAVKQLLSHPHSDQVDSDVLITDAFISEIDRYIYKSVS
jgi:glycosyltransferase involved in cell wall biosynthesis